MLELIQEYKRLEIYKAKMDWREDTTEISEAIADLREAILEKCIEEEARIAKMFME